MEGWRRWFPLAALMTAFFVFSAYLPSVGLPIYASPDETAHAVTAAQIAKHGRAFIPDTDAFVFPGLHPRSWVSVGATIAPVGFLGWSILLVPAYLLVGMNGLPWIGALFFISGIWPFFHLIASTVHVDTKRSRQAAWLATVVTWSFPPFFLYSNRSLFANGPVLVLFLWVSWFLLSLCRQPLSQRGHFTRFILVIAGITWILTMRPIEVMWMIPWWVWLGWGIRLTRREVAAGAFVAAALLLPSIFLAHAAYGTWFTTGYWLHDRVMQAPTSLISSTSFWALGLPYGFHPHHIWWNVSSFFLHRLWWWTLPTLLFLGVEIFWVARWVRHLKRWHLPSWGTPLLLSGWTVFVLLVLYGSGLYADHVRMGAVTMGNSFLRYTLPFGCLMGVVFGLLHAHLSSSFARNALGILVGLLSIAGVYQAWFADDEGLWYTRRELVRYGSIREATVRTFPSSAIILSERSDKIFFPVIRAISPLPTVTDLLRLGHMSVALGLFARPLSQAQKDRWRATGFDVQEVGSFGRERLYRLLPPSSL